jgi:hypothetical protein
MLSLKGTVLLAILPAFIVMVEGEISSFPQLQLVLFDNTNTSNFANFTIYHDHGAMNVTNESHQASQQILTHPFYNDKLRTSIYSFGYTNNMSSWLVQTLISALTKTKSRNIIVVDYGAYSRANTSQGGLADFSAVVENIKKIGVIVGEELWRIFGNKLIKCELIG